jgi:hypothetical protein
MNIYLLERSLAPGTTADEFRYAQTGRLFGSLNRSSSKTIKKRHVGAVNALDVERINAR